MRDVLKKNISNYKPFFISIAVSLAFTAIIAAIYPAVYSKWESLRLIENEPWVYDWQLAVPTFLSHLTSWGGYIIHQIAVWILFFLRMRERKEKPVTSGLTPVTKWFLAINFIFITLHIVQTWFFYDGIAQDVPTWTSQYSVIVMLVIILFLLNPKRGLVFGKSVPVPLFAVDFAKRWHGLYISWAITYTFWFHPAVGIIGLLTGFFYMFLLFTQQSFAATRIHTTLIWITALEFLVGIHGPAIALQKSQSAWPMFATGFLMMTVLTQQFGFKLHKAVRASIIAAYVVLVAVMYYFRGFQKIYEITFIPLTLYGAAMLAIGIAWIVALVRGKTQAAPVVRR
jgi:hypothetical protein